MVYTVFSMKIDDLISLKDSNDSDDDEEEDDDDDLLSFVSNYLLIQERNGKRRNLTSNLLNRLTAGNSPSDDEPVYFLYYRKGNSEVTGFPQSPLNWRRAAYPPLSESFVLRISSGIQ